MGRPRKGESAATRARNEAVTRQVLAGRSLADVAAEHGLSRQRVHQIVHHTVNVLPGEITLGELRDEYARGGVSLHQERRVFRSGGKLRRHGVGA